VVPVTVPQVDAPVATQVAFAVSVTPAGSTSVSVTFVALDGPALVTVISLGVTFERTAAASGSPTRRLTMKRIVQPVMSCGVPSPAACGSVAGRVDQRIGRHARVNATGTVNVALPAPAPTVAAVVPKLVGPWCP
jgi:hypothetical protein